EREAAEAEVEAQKKQEEAHREDAAAEKAAGEEKEKRQAKARALRKEAEALRQQATELRRQAQQLSEAEQLQQQIGEKVGDTNEGLRADVERVRRTLTQNGMERSNAKERMDQVARELARLAERELDQIEPKLSNARKLAELLDEKTREERRAELRQKAQQAEREAAKSEASARKLEQEAEKTEQRARQTEGGEQARLQEH